MAVDDTGSVANNPGPTDFDVLVNDTDVEGDTLSLVSASVSASAGSASVVGGKVRFTPLAAFSGPAVITYVVSDGALTDSGTLTVTVGPDTVDPVATAPTVHFGTGRVDESAPLLISWSSSDIGSGVVSHELQVSIAGGSFTTIYTGAGTSYTKLFPFNKTLVWRVRATDAASNVSAWAKSASRKVVPYQGNSSNVTYSGTWIKVTSADSSGTGYAYTKSLGKRAQVTFTGREVIYVAPKTSPRATRRCTPMASSSGASTSARPPPSWAGSSRARRGAPAAPTRCAWSTTSRVGGPAWTSSSSSSRSRVAAPRHLPSNSTTPPARPAASSRAERQAGHHAKIGPTWG